MLLKVKLWKTIFFVAVFFGPVHSAKAGQNNMLTCGTLFDKQLKYVIERIQNGMAKDMFEASKGGPVETVLLGVFHDLNDDYISRLQPHFGLAFANFCQANSNIKVSEAIESTSKNLRLDMSAKNWGLKEIDAAKLLGTECSKLKNITSAALNDGYQKFNDPVPVMFRAYWSEYDIESDEASTKASTISYLLMSECDATPEKSISQALDTLAMREGLQRKD